MIYDTKLDTKGVKDGMNEIGTVGKVALGSLVAGAAEKATGAVVGLAKSAIEVGSNFETSMSQVAATMGITADQIASGNKDFEMLSAKAKEMGATTKYTATEAAQGLNILAMAGLSATEACEGIDTVLNLAAAGAMSLDQAATYVTGSVKAFSDSMENADYYADLMAKGATLANTNVSALGEAMVNVGATAASYGQEADGLTLSLLRLAEQNVTGSEAATAMNRAMMDLYTPTEKAAAELKRLGVEVYDNAGNAREFNTVVDELNASLAGMSQEEANASKNIIFTTFGLQAFNKMTVASTETVQKFKDGLAEASGSAMQQMKTQLDNLEGKLAIFNSACEAVGVSIYEIFEDMMKDGVDDAAEAMTRLNKSIKTGDLGKSLTRLAEAIGDLSEKAVDFAEDALPEIIDGLTWMLDNAELVTSAIMGIVAANISMSTIAPIVNTLTASWTAYSTANEGATISQWALNTAMNANPAGAIATAIIAVTAALVTFIALTSDEYEAYTKLNKEVTEHIKDNQDLRESLRASAEERKNNRAEMEYEAASARSLVSELKGLEKGADGTIKNQKRLREIVAQLNVLMPELNLVIDEQTGALNMSTEAIEANVEALIKQAKAEAYRAEMEEIAAEQIEAEKQLNQLYKDRAAAIEEVSQAQADYTAALADENAMLDSNGLAVDQAIERRDQAKEALVRLNDEIRESEIAVGDLGNQLEEAAEKAQGDADATNNLADASDNATESLEAHEEAVNEANEAYEKWRNTLYETISKSINIFDEFDQKTAESGTKIIQNMESQISGIENWADNLEKLADKGIDQGLLQHLADMGPAGAGYVQSFVNMTDEELQKAGELFEKSVILPDETVSRIEEAYLTAGQQTGTSYAEGMMAKVNDGTISGSAAEQIKSGIKAMEDALEGKGADSRPGKIGQQIPQDTAAGVEKTSDELTDEVDAVTTDVYDRIEEALAPAKFITIGEGIINGILEGINSKKGELESAINDLESLAENSGKSGGSSSGSSSSSSSASSFSAYSSAFTSGASSYNSYNAGYLSEAVIASYDAMQASMSQALETVPIEVNTSVYLEGEAQGVFNLVRQETDRTVRTTGNNPLMKGEYKG